MLDAISCDRLIDSVKLRNVLVHEYEFDLDNRKLYDSIRDSFVPNLRAVPASCTTASAVSACRNASKNFCPTRGLPRAAAQKTLITRGLVRINGSVAKLGDKVDAAVDKITYNGQRIAPVVESYYIAVNKPKGYITSRRDPDNRRSVYDLLPHELRAKVWSIGRLDFFSEGLYDLHERRRTHAGARAPKVRT